MNRSRITRRQFFRLSALGVSASVLTAACGTTPTPTLVPAKPTTVPAPTATKVPAAPTAAPTTAPAPAATKPPVAAATAVPAAFAFPTQPITLEFWWHTYTTLDLYFKDLIQRYKAVRPNVTINPTITTSSDMIAKLAAGFASGTAPDLIDQDASYYVQYFNKGTIEPLNLDVFGLKSYDELRKQYLPGTLDGATFGDKIYALPYQCNAMSLFINNKLFRAAGLDIAKDYPKTWEDVKALGPKLKKMDGTRTTVKAFDWPYHSNRWELQQFQPLVEQCGAKIMSDDNKTCTINSPAAIKALTLWRDVTKITGDPKTTMNNSATPNQDFIDQRLAMWISFPGAWTQIEASAIGKDYTVVPLPQVDPAKPHTMIYGFQLGVNKTKPDSNKIAAWDFIKFAMSKPTDWLSTVGLLTPAAGQENTPEAKAFPFYGVHTKEMSIATWYVRSEFVNEISQSVGRAIERVIYDGADPKASLDQGQAELDKIMKS